MKIIFRKTFETKATKYFFSLFGGCVRFLDTPPKFVKKKLNQPENILEK
jgi:hypothetical protein